MYKDEVLEMVVAIHLGTLNVTELHSFNILCILPYWQTVLKSTSWLSVDPSESQEELWGEVSFCLVHINNLVVKTSGEQIKILCIHLPFLFILGTSFEQSWFIGSAGIEPYVLVSAVWPSCAAAYLPLPWGKGNGCVCIVRAALWGVSLWESSGAYTHCLSGTVPACPCHLPNAAALQYTVPHDTLVTSSHKTVSLATVRNIWYVAPMKGWFVLTHRFETTIPELPISGLWECNPKLLYTE